MHRCTYGSPSKVWYVTKEVEGVKYYASREWSASERSQYEHEVLNR